MISTVSSENHYPGNENFLQKGSCYKLHISPVLYIKGFSHGSVVKNLPANAEDASSIPGSGRLPGEGNGNPIQYSCLGNPMGRVTWWATVHGVAKELDTISCKRVRHN